MINLIIFLDENCSWKIVYLLLCLFDNKKIKSFLFFLGNICLNVIDCEIELEVDFE